MSELKDYDFMDIEAMDDERLKKSESGRIQLTCVYLKSEVDAAIAELKAKLEDVQATAYTESVDAGMRERKLKRALWLARAERAASWQIHFSLCHNHSIEREFSINGASMPCEGMATMRTAKDWAMIWEKVEQLCRNKAEEYK